MKTIQLIPWHMTQTLNLGGISQDFQSCKNLLGIIWWTFLVSCDYPRLCCQHPNLANPLSSVPVWASPPLPTSPPAALPGSCWRTGSRQTIPDSRTPEGYSLTGQSHHRWTSNAEIIRIAPRVGGWVSAPGKPADFRLLLLLGITSRRLLGGHGALTHVFSPEIFVLNPFPNLLKLQ